NETGALLTKYIFERRAANGTLPPNPVLIKTIVTSALAGKIAQKYGAEVFDLLTGFKFIGGKIGELEERGEAGRFVFGFEESYGYLAGSYVRDKDAVIAAMLAVQAAAYYKAQGKTFCGVLDEIYGEFGIFLHSQLNVTCEGMSGLQHIKDIMSNLRDNPPEGFAGQKTVKMSDYLYSVTIDTRTGTQTDITLPKSDVLAYLLSGGGEVIVRPSGTEPKIKVYLTAVGKTREEALDVLKALEKETGERVN
ncbi:MAG: phospho-sugar mutase, partial [Oscillospiraceae bacterium]|nr:phospho-sugar mutase [Oscillospiraceae bacterium]